jgi:hypothetical protein
MLSNYIKIDNILYKECKVNCNIAHYIFILASFTIDE